MNSSLKASATQSQTRNLSNEVQMYSEVELNQSMFPDSSPQATPEVSNEIRHQEPTELKRLDSNSVQTSPKGSLDKIALALGGGTIVTSWLAAAWFHNFDLAFIGTVVGVWAIGTLAGHTSKH